MSKKCPELPVMYDMSIFKKSNSWTMNEAHKKELDIRSSTIMRSHLKVLQITQNDH